MCAEVSELKDLLAPSAANLLIVKNFKFGMRFAPPVRQERVIGEPTAIDFDLSIVTPRAPDPVLSGVRLRRRRLLVVR